MRATLFATAILVAGLGLQACGSGRPDNKPESSTPFLGDAREKVMPHNPLIDGAFPGLRQDTFYKTYRTSADGKTVSLDDRLVANGRGFVSYCENNSSGPGDAAGTGDGFSSGFYLYNFYGHTSFLVTIRDRTYKVALSSPGDDIIRAYQVLYGNLTDKPARGQPKVTRLGPKAMDDGECIGISYTDNDGSKHEEWFDIKSRRLIDQVVERGGAKLSRHMSRFNPECETMLLRLPEGFTLKE